MLFSITLQFAGAVSAKTRSLEAQQQKIALHDLLGIDDSNPQRLASLEMAKNHDELMPRLNRSIRRPKFGILARLQIRYFIKGQIQMNTQHAKFLRSVGTIAFACLTSGQALTQPASVAFDVGATIFTPLTISKTADLNFGVIQAGSASGTVVISAAGVRTATGTNGPTLLASNAVASPVTVSSGGFTVTGSAYSSYRINFSASSISTGGPIPMTVTNFVTSKSLDEGDIESNNTDTFTVGATLNVGAHQPPGNYQGIIAVSVEYF